MALHTRSKNKQVQQQEQQQGQQQGQQQVQQQVQQQQVQQQDQQEQQQQVQQPDQQPIKIEFFKFVRSNKNMIYILLAMLLVCLVYSLYKKNN